jgi:hypothetical protein
LLNAAAIDHAFRADVLAAPAQAAGRAALAPGEAFGCLLPDQALRLPPICLSDSDCAFLLQVVAGAATLEDVCRAVVALTAPGYTDAVEAVAETHPVRTHVTMTRVRQAAAEGPTYLDLG